MMKLIFNKKFVTIFTISFLIWECLLVIDFVSRFHDDIFGKGFPMDPIFKFLLCSFLSFLGVSILFGLFIATTLTFKHFSFNKSFEFRKTLLGGLWIIICFMLLQLAYNNWILPKANLEMVALTYDFTQTAPDSTLHKTDRQLFKDTWLTASIIQLKIKMGTYDKEIERAKLNMDSILNNISPQDARRLFSTYHLSNYGVKFYSLKLVPISNEDMANSKDNIEINVHDFNELNAHKQKDLKELLGRLLLPVALMLIYLLGASLGFYYNDQKSFLLVILGVFASKIFFGNMLGFSSKISQTSLENILWFCAPFIILLITTIFYLRNALTKNKN